RHRQQSSGHTPEPGPENQGNKNHHRIERKAASHQDRRDEVRLQQMEQQIPGSRKKPLPQRVESQQTHGGQQDDAADGAKVGNKVQHRHQQSPHGGVGHAQEVETSAHDDAQPKVDQRNREQVVGYVLLNLTADFERALLVAQRGHHMHQLLQEQIARGEQQVKYNQCLADARQEGSGPVED